MNNINFDVNGIVYFCSKIKDGNMSIIFEDEKDALMNREKFFKKINIDANNCYKLNVTNSDIIENLVLDYQSEITADAVIITQPEKYIYLLFGDCIPFIAYDEKKSILGFAHLGWKSICLKLHNKLIQNMINNYNCTYEDISVLFGPSIMLDSYAFENPAQLKMPDWIPFIFKKNGLYHIDLESYIVKDIVSCGISSKKIKRNQINTATNTNYFSHYRSMHNSEKEGRFIFGAGIINSNNSIEKRS